MNHATKSLVTPPAGPLKKTSSAHDLGELSQKPVNGLNLAKERSNAPLGRIRGRGQPAAP